MENGPDNKNRPAFYRCIRRTHVAHLGVAWCGTAVTPSTSVIQSPDHAAELALQHPGTVVCPTCVKAVLEALLEGQTPQDRATILAI